MGGARNKGEIFYTTKLSILWKYGVLLLLRGKNNCCCLPNM